MKVGFIGLGSQGGPMARRIVEGGYETTLWARRPATLEPFADTPAKVAESPAELAAASDLVCLCVVGDADVVERCRPVFETYADPVVHLGELGSGQTTKLLNNLLFTANLGTAATALSLANSLGVSPDRLVEVISRGSGNSFALSTLGGIGGLERLAALAGTLLQKDVRLIAELAERAAAHPGAVLDAADATLTLMGNPR